MSYSRSHPWVQILGGDVSPQVLWLHRPPIFSCPTSANWMTFFFGLHYILGKKLGNDDFFLVLHNVLSEILVIEMMIFVLFIASLHFTVVGENSGNRAGTSNFLNHPPQSRKMAKNDHFCRIIPPMLNINLHPCSDLQC